MPAYKLYNSGVVNLAATTGTYTFDPADPKLGLLNIVGFDFMIRRVTPYQSTDTGNVLFQVTGTTLGTILTRYCINTCTTGRLTFGAEVYDYTTVSLTVNNTTASIQGVEVSIGIYVDSIDSNSSWFIDANEPGLITHGQMSTQEQDQNTLQTTLNPVRGLKSGYLLTYSDPEVSGFTRCTCIDSLNYWQHGTSLINVYNNRSLVNLAKSLSTDYMYLTPRFPGKYPTRGDTWYMDINTTNDISIGYGSLWIDMASTAVTLRQDLAPPVLFANATSLVSTNGTVSGTFFGLAYSFAMTTTTTLTATASNFAAGLTNTYGIIAYGFGPYVFAQALTPLASSGSNTFVPGGTGLTFTFVNNLVSNTGITTQTSTANNILPIFNKNLPNTGYSVRLVCTPTEYLVYTNTRDGNPFTPIHRARRTNMTYGADGELTLYYNSSNTSTLSSVDLYKKAVAPRPIRQSQFVGSVTSLALNTIIFSMFKVVKTTGLRIKTYSVINTSAAQITMYLVKTISGVNLDSLILTQVSNFEPLYIDTNPRTFNTAPTYTEAVSMIQLQPGINYFNDPIDIEAFVPYSFYIPSNNTFFGALNFTVVIDELF